MILVYLTLSTDQFTEFDAHYFPETAIRITRLSEPKNYSLTTRPGRTVLCAELPCAPGGPEWSMSDEALGALVCRDLETAGLGPLPAVVVNGIPIPAQPATGNIYSYNIQAIGINLYSSRDTNVFSATYLNAPTQNGYQLAYNNLSLIAARWTVEPSLRYYTQKDTQDVKLDRWTPGLRLTYRLRDNVALESEFTWEKTRTVGPASRDDASRGFFYIGYRWDI